MLTQFLLSYLPHRRRRVADICEILPIPQVLRPRAHVGQARRLRYSIISQKGVLRFSLQRRPRGPALGLRAAEVRRHADHHRLYQNLENVLHITELLYGPAGRAQAGDVAE